MDAKQAANIVMSGNVDPSDFQALYTALQGKAEFADAFNQLRKQMLEAYAQGDSIEVSQSGKTADDVITIDQSAKQKVEKENQNIEPWKKQARQDIMQWAAENKSEKPRVEASKDGLHAEFKDGTQVNFIAENHVSVATPAEPKAQNFDVVVALAKKNNKKIKLGENMTPEFRAALIEACAKANVQVSNLSLEDLDTYMKHLPTPQAENNSQAKPAAEKTVAAVAPEKKNTRTDNGIGNVVASVAAATAAKEAAKGHSLGDLTQEQLAVLHANGFEVDVYSHVNDADYARIQKILNPENKTRDEKEVAAVAKGHSLGDLTREQLEALHANGFEVDVYSHVDDTTWDKIQQILNKDETKDEPYTIRDVHGHALSGLSDVELEVLHNSGFEVDRYSHVDDATWAQIQETLKKDTKETVTPVQSKEETVEKTVTPVTEQKVEKKDEVRPVVTEQKVEKKDEVRPVVTEQKVEKKDEVRPVVTEQKVEKKDEVRPVVTEQKVEKKDEVRQSAAVVTDAPTQNGSTKTPERGQQSGIFVPAPVVSSKGENKSEKDNDAHQPVPSKDQDKIVVPAPNGGKTPVQGGNGGNGNIPPTDNNSVNKTNEPKKKEGFWSKIGRKVKKWAVITAVVVGSFIAGRSCSGNAAGTDRDDRQPDKDKIENIVRTMPNDSTLTVIDNNDYEWATAPTQWDRSMSIKKGQFNNIRGISLKHGTEEDWSRYCNNADESAAKLGQKDGLSYMYKAYRLAAWTNELNGKDCDTHGGKWAYNNSGALGEVVSAAIRNIKCGDQIDAEMSKKLQIALNAVDDNGRLNVVALEKLVPGISKYNAHDEQGYIIGTSNYVMTALNTECGTNSQVEFSRGGVVHREKKPDVKPRPDPVVEQDTIVLPPIIKRDTVVQRDTIQMPPVIIPGDTIRQEPVKVVINTPTPEDDVKVAVGAGANLGNRPGAEGVGYAQNIQNNGSDTNLGGSQRRALKKMAKEYPNLTPEQRAKLLEEINRTK